MAEGRALPDLLGSACFQFGKHLMSIAHLSHRNRYQLFRQMTEGRIDTIRNAKKSRDLLLETRRAGCASLARTGHIIQRCCRASAQSLAVLHHRGSAFGSSRSGDRAAPSEAASAVRIPGGFQARAASPASPSCSGSGRSRKLSIPKAARNASVVRKV